MSLSDQLYDSVTKFPAWLESFDAMSIPAWAVLLSIAFAMVGFIFAVREFLSWFLKTNSIVDEVIRLETLVRDLQGDLSALEATVGRLQSTAEPDIDRAPTAVEAPKKAQFRLDI